VLVGLVCTLVFLGVLRLVDPVLLTRLSRLRRIPVGEPA